MKKSLRPNERRTEWILFLLATTKGIVWFLAGDEILSTLLTSASRVRIRTCTTKPKQHGGPFFVDKCLCPRTPFTGRHIFHAVSEAFLCSVAYRNHKSAGTSARPQRPKSPDKNNGRIIYAKWNCPSYVSREARFINIVHDVENDRRDACDRLKRRALVSSFSVDSSRSVGRTFGFTSMS